MHMARYLSGRGRSLSASSATALAAAAAAAMSSIFCDFSSFGTNSSAAFPYTANESASYCPRSTMWSVIKLCKNKNKQVEKTRKG